MFFLHVVYIFFPQTVYCWGSQCCLKCARLGWDAVSASLVLACSCLPTCLPSWLGAVSASLVSSFSCLRSCLPTCLRSGMLRPCPWSRLLLSPVLSPNLSPILAGMLCPPPWSRLPLVSGLVSQLVSGLGCCVRLPSLGLLLSPILSPNLSPTLAGMLCPPPWSRLSLVSGLVSQLVSGLGCCVRVPGLVFSCLRSCLPTCLPSWLGCCVRLPGLVFLLSPVLSPNLSPILAGMLCPPPWSRLSLVSGLVSQLVSGLGCCVHLPGLVFSCLRSWLPTCVPSWLGCCVRLPGLVSQLVSGLGCCVRLPSLGLLLSPILSPNLSPILAGMLSQLVFHLDWDAVSASLVSSCSCLALVSGLVSNLSPILAGMRCPLR